MTKQVSRKLDTLCQGYIEDIIAEAGLDIRQKQLMRLRYIDNKSITEIARIMYISPETYHRIHKTALTKVKSYFSYFLEKGNYLP